MTNFKKDELNWYKQKANIRGKYVNWIDFYPEYLKTPYEQYFKHIQKQMFNGMKILELCCGMGEFSFDIAQKTGAKVLAVDISSDSIEICQKHLEECPNDRLTFKTADVEVLELPKDEFDLICMSGSLSYVDLQVLLKNIKKWLKLNGTFVVVDTYGYSPVFNLKRRFNYWFNKTTKQTVLGIPKKATLDAIEACFEKTEVNYFGIFAFIGPFLKYIIGETMTKKVVDGLDKCFPFLKKYAFKFVLCANNPKK